MPKITHDKSLSAKEGMRHPCKAANGFLKHQWIVTEWLAEDNNSKKEIRKLKKRTLST